MALRKLVSTDLLIGKLYWQEKMAFWLLLIRSSMLTFSYKLGFRKFYPFLTDLQRPHRFKEKREMVSLWKIQLPLWSRWFQEIAFLVSTSEWLQQPQQRPTSIAFWSHSKLILLVINNFQDIREIRERSIKLQPRLVLVLTGGYSLMCVHICIRVFMYSRVCVCVQVWMGS